MANNSNDRTPRPKPDKPSDEGGKQASKHQSGDAAVPDSIPFDELPAIPPGTGLSDPELYLGDLKQRASDSESGILEKGKSHEDSSLFDKLKEGESQESLSDSSVHTVDPTPSKDSFSELSRAIPTAEPASTSGADRPKHDPDAAVGNLEPLSPVSPASGWLDSEPNEAHEGPAAEPLAVEEADLFEAPPVVESSDIFSAGAAPPAKSVEGSDVIAATAFGDVQPPKPQTPERGSDVALSFDQPPGGSTIESQTGSGDLPIAEPVSGSGLLAPSPTEDAPQYGSTPEITPDASSILADLTGPGEVTVDDSSAIRLESPGVPRTSHPSSGTEFDLTIGEGEIPPELAAAADAAESGASSIRLKRPASDPDTRTVEEMHIDSGQVQPVNPALRPDDPSSIFDSINDPVVFRRTDDTGRIEDEDAAVEFSNHPQAAPESEESGSSSSLFNTTPPPPNRPRTRPASEADFQLPAEPALPEEESGVLDWRSSGEEEAYGESSNILVRGSKPVQPSTDPVPDRTAPTRATPLTTPPASREKPLGRKAPEPPAKEDEPKPDSVEVDWVAGSSTEEPAIPVPPRDAPPRKKAKDRPERAAAEPRRGGLLIGGLLGAGFALAACAGVYMSGALPNQRKQTAQQPPANTSPPPVASPEPNPAVPPAGVPGQTRLFAKIQELGRLNASVAAADDGDLRRAREELRGVADHRDAKRSPRGEWEAVQAMIYLGLSHQIANERDAARKVYEAGIKKFPKYAATFQGALDRLDVTAAKPNGVSRRLTPHDAEELLLAIVLLQPPPEASDVEAGVFFWKAVKLANAEKYVEASAQIALAKAAHIRQAKVVPGGGLNPLSDPLHEIFPRSCDDLKTYWDLRAAIYSNRAIAELMKKDGAAKALAELAKRADAAVTLMADLKSANEKLTKAQNDYKDASARLAKVEADYKDASTRLTKSDKELKGARESTIKFEKDYKTAEASRLALEKKLVEETNARASAETARKKGNELIAALAQELQAAKLLPEKYDSAALLAAQKTAANRATGPTLGTLVPTGSIAVGGAGLAAGQLTDIAARLARAEAVAKSASAKLTTETRKLQNEHAAEIKKLTDGYAAETKKLMDTYATSTTKLKDDHATEVKKMAEKFAADMKKLTETYESKVKSLAAAILEERKAAETLAAKFKVDLGAAMSPAQALDVWLPLLTDLRRASDAEPALATATKVLSSAPGDSEDAAKARTVAGLAHFLNGDLAKARELFTAAKASPTYRMAADRAWARAADVGLQSINDPLAPLRRPVEPRKTDPKVAARFLDLGMKAYRAGRYADAVTVLGQAVRANPSEPLAWYFLGAAKWEAGGADEARKDFEQGAEQERLSPLPPRMIGDALAPIQGPARDALSAARP